MAKPRTYTGEATQGSNPNWTPLLELVGEDVTGDFMWMFEVKLSTGVHVQAYKHVDTRRYIHLDARGRAYAYQWNARYRRVSAVDVLTEVFADLHMLGGVTYAQIAASWAAVARLAGPEHGPHTEVIQRLLRETRRVVCDECEPDWWPAADSS